MGEYAVVLLNFRGYALLPQSRILKHYALDGLARKTIDVMSARFQRIWAKVGEKKAPLVDFRKPLTNLNCYQII